MSAPQNESLVEGISQVLNSMSVEDFERTLQQFMQDYADANPPEVAPEPEQERPSLTNVLDDHPLENMFQTFSLEQSEENKQSIIDRVPQLLAHMKTVSVDKKMILASMLMSFMNFILQGMIQESRIIPATSMPSQSGIILP